MWRNKWKPEGPNIQFINSLPVLWKAKRNIVSGDRHLLDVGQYQGIKIMNAQAFLDMWQKQLNT